MPRTLTLVVGVLGIAIAGCKGGDANQFDTILHELESFKTQMCACKDVTCADKVMDARREYKKTMRQKLDRGARPTDAQDRQGKVLEADLQTCRKALLPTGSAGSATGGSAEE